MDASLQKRAEQLATEFASQARTAEDLNGLMRLMMKSALERMLNTEMDVHLGRRPMPAATAVPAEQSPVTSLAEPRARKRSPNRRNGHSQKTVQGDMGELTLTTPRDPAEGVLTAVKEGLEILGANPGEVVRFVHASTLSTNLVLERKGARVAFVATSGFGDMFDISRQYPSGPDRFNLRWKRPPSLVDRALVTEIVERAK